ncbi:Tellurite resistance protein TerB [Lachnospiraceae bacterium YSD2013]|nr:Tellurite resistance protein TerB [Lachnospiraceae bacterium YSD2013]
MNETLEKEYIIPQNPKSLGVLGYLIVLNCQVHSYEMKALEHYLGCIGLKLEETCLDAIIRGDEESISYANAYSAFSSEKYEVKLEILWTMFLIAYVDNHFDESEDAYICELLKCIEIDDEKLDELKKSAFAEAEKIRYENNTIFIREPSKKKQNIFAKIVAWFKKIICKLFNKTRNDKKRNEDKYKKEIAACAEIAREDIELVEPAYCEVLEKCRKTITDIKEYKKTLSLETGLSANVAQVVGTFVDALNDEVLKYTERERDELQQKKRTISDYTISLVGRTKAGKSTLHSILTQQGRDRIGVGKQRTTRFNWVYQWNLLRIIDTPGIGSPEAGGRKDEEIAESVLGESDIICLVVADDSIQNDILEFIEKIAVLNKPVIILLNHKENITQGVKLRKFLENPKKWLDDTGEDRLEGHMNRIMRYAKEKGFDKLLYIYPVFLLAALMSGEDEYSQYRDILWENSNMDIFIDQISTSILESGRITRSQTILDETTKGFALARKAISDSQKVVVDQMEFLKKEKDNKIGTLKETVDEVAENVRKVVEDRLDDLAKNRALDFAEEYIGNGTKVGDDINEKWKAYLNEIRFETKLKSDIEAEIVTYREKADRTVEDLFENLYYSINLSLDFNKVDIPIQFDIKRLSRFTSTIIGIIGGIIAASNPLGWILVGIGVAGNFLTNLFKTKKARRQEAIDKVYMSINENIMGKKEEKAQSISAQVRKELLDNSGSIASLFDDLMAGLKATNEIASSMIDKYTEKIDAINRAYAWRILQFFDGKTGNINWDEINREIVTVDRTDKDKIIIETRSSHAVNRERVDKVLAEEIIIERRA